MVYDLVIIGGGAAGLFAASNIEVHSGLILEKTGQIVTKLLMSGAGQCNITHAGDIKDYITHYGSNGKKIRSCLYKHNNLELIEFLHRNDIETITREDGKVFPKSMKASDVLNMMIEKAKINGFTVKLNSPVEVLMPHISDDGANLWKIVTDKENYLAKRVIIASGGCSYPTTGSDGNFFKVLSEGLGVEITKLYPSLSPVNVYDYGFAELSGISFPHCQLSLWRDGRKLSAASDDALLLTHTNFSGPLVLNHSRYMRTGDTIKFNYIYPVDYAEALKKITTAMKKNKSSVSNVVSILFNLPRSFARELCTLSQDKPKAIARKLTEDTYTVKSTGGFDTAMATSGGVSLKEISSKTMELKKCPGIYVIGECLDVDGDTGGYNLQFAYSSAMAVSDALKSI